MRVAVVPCCFLIMHAYDRERLADKAKAYTSVVQGTTLVLFLTALYYFLVPGAMIARGVMLLSAPPFLLMAAAIRVPLQSRA